MSGGRELDAAVARDRARGPRLEPPIAEARCHVVEVGAERLTLSMFGQLDLVP